MIEADYLAVAFKQGFNEAKLQAEERIAALKAVLKPFIEELEAQELEVPHLTDGDGFIRSYGLRLRHLRAARAAYLGEKHDNE